MATKKCPAPKGITITRSGNKFTAKWTAPDKEKVSGQSIVWSITDARGVSCDYKESSVGSAATSSTFDATSALKDYYPELNDKVKSVKVRITNTKKGYVSASNSKSYAVSLPNSPTIAFAVENELLKVTVSSKQGDHAWRKKTMVTIEAFNERGALVSIVTAYPTGDSYSRSLGAVTPNPKDAIRYFYVIASTEGPRGSSKNVVSKHSIAVPSRPSPVNVVAGEDGIYFVSWRYDALGGFRPADFFEVQYCDFAQDEMEGIDSASFSKAKSGIGGGAFNTQTENLGIVPEGKRRHFRVVATHDTNISFGSAAAYDWGRPLAPKSVKAVASTRRDAGTDELAKCYEVTFEWPEGTWPGAFARVYMDSPVNEMCAPIQFGEGGEATVKSPAITDDSAHRFGVRIFVAANMDRRLEPRGFVESEIVWSDAAVAFVYGVRNLTASCREDGESVDLQWENTPASTGGRPVTGVQVAHSGHIDAFVSNEQPTITEFDSDNYPDIERLDHVVLFGLETGEEYYFWVRRFRKSGEEAVYGLWEIATATVGEGTEALIVANALKSCTLTLARTWACADRPSVAASVHCTYEEGNGPIGASIDMADATGDTVRTWTLDEDQESATLDLAGMDPGAYTFTATAVNSAGPLTSAEVVLTIVEPPVCSLDLPTGAGMEADPDEGAEGADQVLALTALPIVAKAQGNASMTLTVKAEQDFETESPDGIARLYEGQVIGTYQVTPEEDGPATLEIDGIGLLDGAIYVAELVATDRASGLASEPSTARFRVDWARKAVPPGLTVELDAGELSATLEAKAPDGADESDRCDIYRVSADGVACVARDAAWGQRYIDRYAPFNHEDVAYRAALRTPYGSVAWGDCAYELLFDSLRIDWPYGSVELPWSVSMSDSRTKESTVEKYLGGERRAFVGAAVGRSVGITTELDPEIDGDAIAACVDLSKYAGVAFVRTAEGDAFCAVADVSLEWDADGQCVQVSIDAEETDANGDYEARPVETGEIGGEGA